MNTQIRDDHFKSTLFELGGYAPENTRAVGRVRLGDSDGDRLVSSGHQRPRGMIGLVAQFLSQLPDLSARLFRDGWIAAQGEPHQLARDPQTIGNLLLCGDHGEISSQRRLFSTS